MAISSMHSRRLGQLFAVESPLNPGFADRVGAATLGQQAPDFVIGGRVKPGAALESTRRTWAEQLSSRYKNLGEHAVSEATRLLGMG